MSNKQNTSSGGLGCIGFFIVIAAIAGVWMWSQGADPREAAAAAMVLSAKVTGGACALLALLFGLIFAGAWWSDRRRYSGWRR